MLPTDREPPLIITKHKNTIEVIESTHLRSEEPLLQRGLLPAVCASHP